jgi:parallel beta-helix repeat protein
MVPTMPMDRRTFLTRAAAAMAAVNLDRWIDEPWRPQSRVLDIKDFGARADGRTDDTAAFARALAAFDAAGGRLIVGAGTYAIDPLQSIVLRSRVTMQMHANAVLAASAVEEGTSAVVTVDGVHDTAIIGGAVRGERAGHRGRSGEWGMGIQVRGSANVTISDVRISDCWGDGIYVGSYRKRGLAGSTDVIIRRCHAIGNRRQGLSITAATGVRVEDSEFSGTAGASPQSGIDVEPNRGEAARDITIARCTCKGNAGRGVILSGAAVANVILDSNTIEGNYHDGILLNRARDVIVRKNRIVANGNNGIFLLREVERVAIENNVIRDNATAFPYRYDNVMIANRSSRNAINGNVFTGAQPKGGPRFDIRIAGSDCAENRVQGNTMRAAGSILDRGRGTVSDQQLR